MTAAEASDTPPSDGLRLEVVAGKAAGATISVPDRLVFGRQSDEPGRLGDDPELSRHHAQISRSESGAFSIEDLASTNGTYVNGERVSDPVELGQGDIIDLGSTRMVARDLPEVAPAAPSPVDVRAATVIVDVPEGMQPAAPVPAAPEALAPEPPPPPPPPPPEPVPPIELHVVIDVEHSEASIELADSGSPLRLRLQDGRWQPADADG